jgi:hypothetical protein
MKKSFLIAVLVLFSLSACIPSFLGGGEEAPAPEAPAADMVDINATVDAEASTQAAQTMSALDEVPEATPTLEPATPTEEAPATATETLAPTEESTATPTADAEAEAETEADAEGTPETDLATATGTMSVTATEAITQTPAPTATSVYPSPTSPVAINMPPESLVPYRAVEVKNTLKGKVYISMQGITAYDYRPVIEYDIPAFAKVRFRVPIGDYKIVVYVVNEPLTRHITINKGTNLRIKIYRHEFTVDK